VTYEHREGSGSLFLNKKGADNHPDYKGDFMLNGTLYEIAAWAKTTGAGKPFLSLKVQPKREQTQQPQREAPKPEPRGGGDLGDDIPFSACKE